MLACDESSMPDVRYPSRFVGRTDYLRRASVIAAAASGLLVIFVYVFFGSVGRMTFRELAWNESHRERPGAEYYVRLAEGFRSHHLWMESTPDPRLASLADPYDPQQRKAAGVAAMWDASYYRGHYYLYFSPLPVLTFYLPWHFFRHAYPSDPFVAVFFCAWAFAAAALLLKRALPARSRIPLPLWLLLAGVGNVIAYLLSDVRVYEVAILCGMAMSTTWALALFRFVDAPSVSRAAWMSLWLALSAAARPHLILLIIPTLLAIHAARQRLPLERVVVAVALPIACWVILSSTYNYARFGKLTELGTSYQIEDMSCVGARICSIRNTNELLRFVNTAEHYLFWAPTFHSRFPYVDARDGLLDPAVSANLGSDTVVGIVALVPLVALGGFFALLLASARREASAAVRTALCLMLGGSLVLGVLGACWWVVTRYSLDFMLLLVISSILSIEYGFALLEEWNVRTTVFRTITIVLAVYSILTGVLLGFVGSANSFRYENPKLYLSIGERLHVKLRP